MKIYTVEWDSRGSSNYWRLRLIAEEETLSKCPPSVTLPKNVALDGSRYVERGRPIARKLYSIYSFFRTV